MALPSKVDRNYLKLIQLQSRFMLSYTDHDFKIEDVEKLLSSDFDINYAMPKNNQVMCFGLAGYTALHIVVEFNRAERISVLKLILNLGADLTCKTEKGFTPLRLAFKFYNSSSKYVSSLTKKDPVKNPVIELLLSAHREFNNATNPRCNSGISHMHIACLVNNLEVVKFFLEAGVDVNEAVNSDSSILPGYTCLHIAVKNQNSDMVSLLLSHGADVNCVNARGLKPLHLLNDKYPSDDVFKLSEPIFKSELIRNIQLLSIMSKFGKNNSNVLKSSGLSCLHLQSMKEKQSAKELEDLENLLKSGVNVNAAIHSKFLEWPGYTPLRFAVSSHNIEVITLLLENGANFFVKDAAGYTPFDICSNTCTPAEFSQILRACAATKAIKLSNGSYLPDVISKFEKTDELRDYLTTTDVNSVIPLDSLAWPGKSLLHLAVIFSQYGDASKFKICLESGADLMMKDAENMTALHLGLWWGKQLCLQEITVSQIDTTVNPIDKRNLSHFHAACLAHNIELVKKFLDDGVSPDLPADINMLVHVQGPIDNLETIQRGSTPLHIAEHIWSREMLQLLLERGANPLCLDADGLSWIHRRFSDRKCHMFEDLFWIGDTVFQSNSIAPGGLSHFHIACYVGSTRAVEALLPYVVNINEPINSEINKYIKDLPGDVHLGDTPLILALRNRNDNATAIVELLLANNADVKAKNEKDQNPLHVAIMTEKPKDLILELFLKSSEFTEKSPAGHLSRLHVACYLSDEALIKTFLEDGDDIDSKINSDSPFWRGFSPLDVLPTDGNFDEILGLLLGYVLENYEYPIPVDYDAIGQKQQILHKHSQRLLLDQEGLSIFHLICMGNDPESVQRLLNFGVNVDAPSDYMPIVKYTPFPTQENAGFTPLRYALQFGDESIVEILLKHGADIYREDSFGITPIHWAALNHPEKFNIFLRIREVDIFMKNSFGVKVIDMIFQNRRANQLSTDDFIRLLSHSSVQNVDLPTKMLVLKLLTQNFPEPAFKTAIEYIPDLNIVYADGSNIFHHLALPPSTLSISPDVYRKNIELLMKRCCDFDRQDKEGKTPLHNAVISKNLHLVKILSFNGANINATDSNGKIPYSYCFMPDYPERFLITSIGDLQSIMGICDFFTMIVNQMDATHLHLHPFYLGKSRYTMDPPEDFSILTEMENVCIYRSYPLRAVFTENMVVAYSAMSVFQRRAIIEYADSDEMRQRFNDWIPLYKMQVGRAQKRLQLFEPALESLQSLLDPRLPRYFVQSILMYLSEKDWKNLSGDINEE